MIHTQETQNNPLERVRTIPVSHEDLKGTVVLAQNLLQFCDVRDDLRDLVEDLKMVIAELRRELDEQRSFNHEIMTRLELMEAARKHPRLELPPWFWQLESEDHLRMLKRRAGCLRAAKVNVDDAWDLLNEFAADYCYLQCVDDLLSQAILAAYGKRIS